MKQKHPENWPPLEDLVILPDEIYVPVKALVGAFAKRERKKSRNPKPGPCGPWSIQEVRDKFPPRLMGCVEPLVCRQFAR
jgi:hypothetical protein